MTKATTRLRRLLEGPDPVIAGGAYDALSARVVEAAGFHATYVGGLNVETALLGMPDVGLISMSELATHVSHIAAATSNPLIVDADTGFGSVMNVVRTVRSLERAGAAAVHFEDQAEPKRMPYLGGRKLVARDVAVRRLRAACEGRTDQDFVIVARCDGDAVSTDELIERARLYLEAGVDLVMPMLIEVDGAPFAQLPLDERREVHARVCRAVDGPLACPQLPTGLTVDDVREAGYRYLGLPLHALAASIEAQFTVWDELRRTGTVEGYFDRNPLRIAESPATPRALAVMQFCAMDEWLEIDRKFGSEAD
jgi:methylisocitrate lyase